MMPFDPDTYLGGKSGGFDPDAYLGEAQPHDTPARLKLGPVSNIAEAGARGLNWATQQVGRLLPEDYKPTPREPIPYSNEVDLGESARAVGGLVKNVGEGLVQTAKDVHSLPGQMASGEVPLGEGMLRSLNVATMGIPGAQVVRAGQAARGAPLAAEKIVWQGERTYKGVANATRGVDLGIHPTDLASSIVGKMEQLRAPRPLDAKPVYEELANINTAQDVADLVGVRKRLGEFVRTGSGEERRAALIAKDLVGVEIDRAAGPGISNALATADKNFAIGHKALKTEEAIENAGKAANEGGPREGTRLREVGREYRKKPKPYHSQDEIEAAERLAQGRRAIQGFVGATDVSRGGWGPVALQTALGYGTGGSSLASVPAGYVGGKLFDATQRSRAAALAAATRAKSPAAQAAGGFQLRRSPVYANRPPYGFTPLVPRYSPED